MDQARVRDSVQLHEHARGGPELRRDRAERVARPNRVRPTTRGRRGRGRPGRRRWDRRRRRGRCPARRGTPGRARGGRRRGRCAQGRPGGSAGRRPGRSGAPGQEERAEGRPDDHHGCRCGQPANAIPLEGHRHGAPVDDDRQRRHEATGSARRDVVRTPGPARAEAEPALVDQVEMGCVRQPRAAVVARRLGAPPRASRGDEERADEPSGLRGTWLVGRGLLHVLECIAAPRRCRFEAGVRPSRALRSELPRKRRNPGDGLFSRKAALSVSSALESLTSVFGMGTGVASPLESPGFPACGSRFGSGSITRSEARRAPEVRSSTSRRSGVQRRPRDVTPRWIPFHGADPWSALEKVKPSTISTAWLHPSPGFHVPPIKQVVSLRSYPVNPVGNLISRRASHLDAFSAYPNRT